MIIAIGITDSCYSLGLFANNNSNECYLFEERVSYYTSWVSVLKEKMDNTILTTESGQLVGLTNLFMSEAKFISYMDHRKGKPALGLVFPSREVIYFHDNNCRTVSLAEAINSSSVRDFINFIIKQKYFDNSYVQGVYHTITN